jgi:hypothetical protein
MSTTHLSFLDIIDELRLLGQKKETGSFIIVSNENHYATVGFEHGQIISLQYRLVFGTQAIPLIAKIKHGSCSFTHTTNFIRRTKFQDNEAIIQRMLATHLDENNSDTESVPNSKIQPEKNISKRDNSSKSLHLTQQQMEEIENILIEELGPMGSIVMDSVMLCPDIDTLLNVVQNEIGETGRVRPVIHQIMDVLTP